VKIEAGEVDGLHHKGGLPFRFHIGGALEKSPAETSFVINLIWRGLQIISAKLRIMWRSLPKDGDCTLLNFTEIPLNSILLDYYGNF